MVKYTFKNILIPVDFTVNTEVAIRKALSLSDGPGTTIHLLNIFTVATNNIISIYQYFANYSFKDNEFDMKVAKDKLENIRDYITSIRKDIEVVTRVLFNPSIELAIVQLAYELRPDLIIIGKNSHHSWLPFLNTVVPSRLAMKTECIVLTVKPGALNNAIKTIVVPISDNFPSSKFSIINAFTNRSPVHIKLVTFLTAQDDVKVMPASLLNAYRLLRNNASNYVSYEILHGHNKVRAVLRYCKKINADMVIVNPGTETKVGWFNKQMSDMLPTNSKTQILAVHPVS